MRRFTVIAPLAFALALSACASQTTGTDRYTSELDRLAESCRERGGILAPTAGQTGRPQTDNVCEIRGQTARAPQR